jgi:hypothetical protein
MVAWAGVYCGFGFEALRLISSILSMMACLLMESCLLRPPFSLLLLLLWNF